jgi:hypothetical protein
VKIDFTDIVINIGTRFCDGLYRLAEKLEDVACNMEIDPGVLETVPTKIVEKKRKTKRTGEEFFDARRLKNFEPSEGRIKADAVLDGFDRDILRAVKRRVIDCGKFIMRNAETGEEKNLAVRLAKMFLKEKVIITDTYLTGNESFGAYFQPKQTTEKNKLIDLSYIGLDITTLTKNDNARLINNLVHETHHALHYYTGNTEYSIIDETRAWNAGLRFSNKYRAAHGIPVERDQDYTVEELEKMGPEYKNAFNVNTRYGPPDNIIEKIGYGIANLIDDAADSVNALSGKILDRM